MLDIPVSYYVGFGMLVFGVSIPLFRQKRLDMWTAISFTACACMLMIALMVVMARGFSALLFLTSWCLGVLPVLLHKQLRKKSKSQPSS